MRVTALLLLTLALPSMAQQSANYKLSEHVLNAGGHPEGGAVLVSTNFRITLDSIGDEGTKGYQSGGNERAGQALETCP